MFFLVQIFFKIIFLEAVCSFPWTMLFPWFCLVLSQSFSPSDSAPTPICRQYFMWFGNAQNLFKSSPSFSQDFFQPHKVNCQITASPMPEISFQLSSSQHAWTKTRSTVFQKRHHPSFAVAYLILLKPRAFQQCWTGKSVQFYVALKVTSEGFLC